MRSNKSLHTESAKAGRTRRFVVIGHTGRWEIYDRLEGCVVTFCKRLVDARCMSFVREANALRAGDHLAPRAKLLPGYSLPQDRAGQLVVVVGEAPSPLRKRQRTPDQRWVQYLYNMHPTKRQHWESLSDVEKEALRNQWLETAASKVPRTGDE